MLVVTNIVRENIEVTGENQELYWIQDHISDLSNFILTYLDVHDFSSDAKDKFIRIIDNDESFDGLDMYEKVMFNSTYYLMNVLNQERNLMR